MPITMAVQRPAEIIPGRTQSYRVILTLSGIPDPALFVCTPTSGVMSFDHVAAPGELYTVSTNPARIPYRTAQLDIMVPACSVADEMISAIIEDLRAFLRTGAPPTNPVNLSGASV